MPVSLQNVPTTAKNNASVRYPHPPTLKKEKKASKDRRVVNPDRRSPRRATQHTGSAKSGVTANRAEAIVEANKVPSSRKHSLNRKTHTRVCRAKETALKLKAGGNSSFTNIAKLFGCKYTDAAKLNVVRGRKEPCVC